MARRFLSSEAVMAVVVRSRLFCATFRTTVERSPGRKTGVVRKPGRSSIARTKSTANKSRGAQNSGGSQAGPQNGGGSQSGPIEHSTDQINGQQIPWLGNDPNFLPGWHAPLPKIPQGWEHLFLPPADDFSLKGKPSLNRPPLRDWLTPPRRPPGLYEPNFPHRIIPDGDENVPPGNIIPSPKWQWSTGGDYYT